MSDPTDTTEATEPEPAAPDAEAEAPDTDEPAKLRAEAAKYRRRLRETEAERDQLASRLADHDRAEVERQLGDRLADPSDLWLTTGLDDLRGDDGAIDPDKVEAARDRAIAEHPHWRPAPPDFDGGPRGELTDTGMPSFGEALKSAR